MAGDLERLAVHRNRFPLWLETSVAAAVDLVFPPQCVACGSECASGPGKTMFCTACDRELAICPRPTCARCANICSTADLARGDCANCRGSKLLFEAARTIGPYQGPLRQAVLRAKHGSFEALAAALGERLAEAIEQSPFEEQPEIVAAVPMHWLKRAWRGTNPAGTVAASVARRLGLPLASGALRCVRLLKRQATLTPPERRRNVRGAFRISGWARVANRRVLLIDDVMTTGATAHEGSRALLDAGAAAVFIATVARSSAEA